MDKIKAMYRIMCDFNIQNDDCNHCPFFDDYCSGDGNKPCLVESLVELLEVCLREGVTLDA